jgi:hypothetical protein
MKQHDTSKTREGEKKGGGEGKGKIKNNSFKTKLTFQLEAINT